MGVSFVSNGLENRSSDWGEEKKVEGEVRAGTARDRQEGTQTMAGVSYSISTDPHHHLLMRTSSQYS